MRLSCALRKSVGRLLIGVLLFAQFAVASYACPGLNGMGSMANRGDAKAVLVAAADTAAMAESAAMSPGCDQMDPGATNLCVEHCREGQQSVDTAAAPVVGLGFPTFLYPLPLEPQHLLGSGRSFPAPDAGLDAAPEPPHAILHCVFRT
jgi:hypothetical protein